MEVNVISGDASAPMVQVQVAKTADNVDRFVVSAYVPVDYDELNSSSAKTWMAAIDISSAAPNSVYLSN